MQVAEVRSRAKFLAAKWLREAKEQKEVARKKAAQEEEAKKRREEKATGQSAAGKKAALVTEILKCMEDEDAKRKSDKWVDSDYFQIWQVAQEVYTKILKDAIDAMRNDEASFDSLVEIANEFKAQIRLRKLQHMSHLSKIGAENPTDMEEEVASWGTTERKRQSAEWHAFDESKDTKVSLDDIPLPTKEALLAMSCSKTTPRKKQFFKMAKRLHPDKFIGKHGRRVEEKDKQALKEKVTAAFQDISNILQ